MRLLFRWAGGLVLAAILAACAAAADAQTIQIKDAWVRAAAAGAQSEMETPPGEPSHDGEMSMGFTSAAYLQIINRGKVADRLLRVSSPVAETAGLHETTMTGDVMSMQPVNYVEAPANGKVELKPGGLHIMLIGLKQDLKPGERVPLELVFEKAGVITVEAEVRAP